MSGSEKNIKVGIVMGSESDLPTMVNSARALDKLDMRERRDYEMRIKSAHRTPDAMIEYAESAEKRGLEVIVAGAGGSAHLPGMIAAETIVPVVAVAVTNELDVMNRPLGSMIGMPEGTPLAVFQGEKGAFNAGLFAARLLARHNPALREAYLKYEESLRAKPEADDESLVQKGSVAYLNERNFG